MLSVAALLMLLWARWLERRQDPWLRLLQRAQQRLVLAGLPGAATAPPRALAQALQRINSSVAPAEDPSNESAWRNIGDWLLRLEQWRCTMASACAMGLPADLETLGEALGLVQQKDKRGKQLITVVISVSFF